MTTEPMPEQWTPEQVSQAFASGNVDAIAAARQAGQLDSILNPTPEV